MGLAPGTGVCTGGDSLTEFCSGAAVTVAGGGGGGVAGDGSIAGLALGIGAAGWAANAGDGSFPTLAASRSTEGDASGCGAGLFIATVPDKPRFVAASNFFRLTTSVRPFANNTSRLSLFSAE